MAAAVELQTIDVASTGPAPNGVVQSAHCACHEHCTACHALCEQIAHLLNELRIKEAREFRLRDWLSSSEVNAREFRGLYRSKEDQCRRLKLELARARGWYGPPSEIEADV